VLKNRLNPSFFSDFCEEQLREERRQFFAHARANNGLSGFLATAEKGCCLIRRRRRARVLRVLN
jgi:hypothetical protein